MNDDYTKGIPKLFLFFIYICIIPNLLIWTIFPAMKAKMQADQEKDSFVIERHSSTPVDYASLIDLWYINVGQGECTLITSSDRAGHGVLIDTGPRTGYSNVVAALKAAKVDTIDMLILTDQDMENIQNTDRLLKNYKVNNIVMPSTEENEGKYWNLTQKFSEDVTNIRIPEDEIFINYGNAVIAIYQLDSYKLITKLIQKNRTFIFLGNAGNEELYRLKESGVKLNANVIKMANHGSSEYGYNSEWLYNAVRPDFAVISCGLQNAQGYPHQATMEMLYHHKVGLYRTDLQGTIHCRCDGDFLMWYKDPTQIYADGETIRTSMGLY